MFGLFRKKKPPIVADALIQPPQVSPEENMRILGTYVALLQAHPHGVMDVSWLPADKQKMSELFELLWLHCDNERRKKIENWWCLLSHFQPGVGAVPVDIEISKDNPTVQQWRERKERVEKWLEIAIAEDKKYEREIEALRQQFSR